MRRTTTLNPEPSFAQSKGGTLHGLTLKFESRDDEWLGIRSLE